MATSIYGFETIDYGTAGWNGLLSNFMNALDALLHTYLPVTLGEAVSAFEPLFLHTDGKYYKAAADGSQQPAIGLAIEAGAADGVIRLRRVGPITNASWAWIPTGSPVYLGASEGTLTQTKPTANPQIIGYAMGATTLLVMPRNLLLEVLQLTDAGKAMGTDQVTDPAAMTASTVAAADAGASYTSAEQALINEIKADFNNLYADVSAIRTQLAVLLAALRQTGGCGVLSD